MLQSFKVVSFLSLFTRNKKKDPTESNLYSDDLQIWDRIIFLKKQHFGLIIGKERKTINSLEKGFNVKIQVNNKENKVEIKGKIEDKLAAIEKIKYTYNFYLS